MIIKDLKSMAAGMNTGCPDCDKILAAEKVDEQFCPKHKLEYLEWCAVQAKREYEESKA